jgi:chromate reductase, NAD(P)H dehydrogenase (quinone)
MDKPRILALAGSFRRGSFNRKLLACAIKELEAHGAEVDIVDLKALAIPVYDGDDEAATGIPKPAQELRERIQRAHGIFIASPEYNHSIPGGLKNVIDWVSRPPKQPLRGKVGAICGASSGHFGTVRMQPHLRQTLTALGVWLSPTSMMLPKAEQAFDEEGKLKDPGQQKELAGVVEALLVAVQRHQVELPA